MPQKESDQIRKSCIKSYVTDPEYKQIVELSEQCDLSISELIRRTLLGQDIFSKADKQTFLDLLKVNADLGRLGGLLKFWLGDKQKSQGYTPEIRKVLKQIEARQRELMPVINKARQNL